MPNWCYNNIYSDTETIHRIYDKYVDSGEYFKYMDFDKIDPIPKIIENIDGEVYDDICYFIGQAHEEVYTDLDNWDIRMTLQINNVVNKNNRIFKSFDEDKYNRGKSYYEEYNKIDHRIGNRFNLRDWTGYNWGTSKCGFDPIVSDLENNISCITIDTAWSSPNKVIRKLSEKENAILYMSTVEEQVTVIGEEYIFKNGECIIEDTNKSTYDIYQLYNHMMGAESKYIKVDKNNNVYYYNDYIEDEEDVENNKIFESVKVDSNYNSDIFNKFEKMINNK